MIAVLLPAAATTAQTILPPPPQPAGNASTPGKVLLGKALFWDEQLSSTRTVACGTCHRFATGGSDPRAGAVHPGPDGAYGTFDDITGSFGVVRHDSTAHYVADVTFGVERQVTGRKAPSMINAAYSAELFWDGRAASTFRDPVTNQVVLSNGGALESQAAGPPVSDVEMTHIGRTWIDISNYLPALAPLALATNVPVALVTFINGQTYAQLFQQVYGSAGVTPQRILFAIAAYERSLVSDQSPHDLNYVGQYTFTFQEAQGMSLFEALCDDCHTDVARGAGLGVIVPATGPVLGSYRNIGLRPNSEDQGRFGVTNNPLDMGRFKVPGLRNVALRAPFFHNGSAATLTDVVDFYGRGGDFHANQDPLMFNIIGALASPSQKAAIVAFLNTLTDPRVAGGQPPFDRPTLWSEGSSQPSIIGTGTAGSGGLPPRASAFNPPYLGSPAFTVGVDRTAPGSLAFIVWDLGTNPAPTMLLGHSVYLQQTPALVSGGIGLTQGSGAGGGYASLAFPLPAAASFAGVTLAGQFLIVDPLGPVGFGSSNAFELTLF